MNGDQNPEYDRTFVFTNDFPCLLPDETGKGSGKNLFTWEGASGTSRVICYSPRHDLTLPMLPADQIEAVVNTWVREAIELSERFNYLQIFENKGSMMGASNPHPHGQIWASNFIPSELSREAHNQFNYFEQHHSVMLMDYAEQELEFNERIVCSNTDWVAVVPFWATWPFETLLLPRKHVARIQELTQTQRSSLAELLKNLLTRYDHLFGVSFPYSMGWHMAPSQDEKDRAWQLHAHFYPPLLRSATIKKFMVGYELLAEAQRDLTPEQASARLRELPDSYPTVT